MSEDEEIKALLKRHQDLQNQKAIAEDRLGTARINLQKAKEDAREKYGTDDYNGLRGAFTKSTLSGVAFTAAALSLTGLPLLFGLISFL